MILITNISVITEVSEIYVSHQFSITEKGIYSRIMNISMIRSNPNFFEIFDEGMLDIEAV